MGPPRMKFYTACNRVFSRRPTFITRAKVFPFQRINPAPAKLSSPAKEVNLGPAPKPGYSCTTPGPISLNEKL